MNDEGRLDREIERETMLSFQSMKESGKSKYCQTSRNGHLCNLHKD